MRAEESLLVEQCCSLAIRAHSSSSSVSSFLVHSVSNSSSSTVVFAFPGSWSAEDWIAADGTPFGDAEVDHLLFPSLRSIGSDVAARVNVAFLRSFQRLLVASRLKSEVHRAVAQGKHIAFTGHSSGGSVAVLATIWLLEQHLEFNNGGKVIPFCVTFGSPLVGDSVFVHAINREDWSRCFLHFVMPLDIVPRILLTPLSSLKEQFQAILHFLCPKSFYFNLESIGRSELVTVFYTTVLRSALSISSYCASLSMGCTNSLLETLTAFVKLTPYRPFGTYNFCTSNGRLLIVKNSDAVLQLLFYSLQRVPEQDLPEVAFRSLNDHLQYELKMKQYLRAQNEVHEDCFEAVPLSSDDGNGDEMQLLRVTMEDLHLSKEARLCLRAASIWEKQRMRNQATIDAKFSKIQEALKFLNDYRATCEIRGLGYYDTFKIQRNSEDFDANVKRIELAGLWDEIVEMLRRNELPDSFENRTEWVNLGTSYRRLVEPLDIANYYRHSKNEDTGSYMVKGRPKRYRYTQRWLEQAQRMAPGSSSESCFWAMVEDLSVDASNNTPFEEVKERVLELENEALRWTKSGKLGGDVLLGESTFVRWWNSLPKQHRLESCIARIMAGDESFLMR